MLDLLSKPIIIGRISFPLLILVIIIIVIAVFVFLTYLYVIEVRKNASEKELKQEKEVRIELSKEEKYKKDIEKLKRSIPYLSKKEASSRFIKIIRSFFRDLLELSYEFTFEELADELKEKGRNKDLIDFSEKISDYKYRKGDMSKKELIKLCKDFIKILNYEAVPEVKKIEKHHLFGGLRKPTVPHVGKPPVDNKQKDSKDS